MFENNTGSAHNESGQQKFSALNKLFMNYGLHPETEEEKVSLMYQAVNLVQYLDEEGTSVDIRKGIVNLVKIIADHFDSKELDVLQITSSEGNTLLHKYFSNWQSNDK